MLAVLAGAFLAVIFLIGLVVVVMTLLGARRRAEDAGPREVALPPKPAGAVLRQVADADIEQEIRVGHLFNAVRLYQEKTGASAQDARAAVEAWKDRLSAS